MLREPKHSNVCTVTNIKLNIRVTVLMSKLGLQEN